MRRADRNLRHDGLRCARQGDLAAARGDRDTAKTSYREAIANLVEAFLEDRQANADLFVVGHRIGVILEGLLGCVYEIDEARRTGSNRCPIQALHSRVGASVAMVTRSTCSICGAADLRCDHIPGESYGDETCSRQLVEILNIDHLALTQNPDFAFTFQTTPLHPLSEIEEVLGERWEPGKTIYSKHCEQCYGRYQFRPDDVDRSLWPRPGEAHDLADEAGSTEEPPPSQSRNREEPTSSGESRTV